MSPFSSPSLSPSGFETPSLLLGLHGSVSWILLLSLLPAPSPPPQPAVTVTSELKYSWKHRPRLVNFMSRFSAQMT